MRLPAADRRSIVESLLDIGVFSAMNVVLKNRIAGNREDIRNCETAIEIAQSKVTTQSKYISMLEEKSRASIEEIEKEIKLNTTSRDSLSTTVTKGGNILHVLQKNRDLKRKKDQVIADFRKIEASLEKKLDGIKTDLSNHMSADSISCPSCGQPLTEDHRQKEIQAKQGKLDEIKNALVGVKMRVETEEKFLIENKLDSAEDDYDRFLGILNEHRQKLGVAEKMLERLQADVEKIRKSHQSLEDEQTALEALEEKLDEHGRNLSSKQHEQKLLASAQVILKDSGIKTKVIRHYLPIMNKLINHYLACMDFFVQFNLDENFDETIKSRHRDEFTYASFSEGEKMRIDLSLLLAWREIARMKNSTNCNLLVLDEVFDSSLDGTGMDEFMKLLKAMGARCNIFVISHKSDQLIDKFQEVLTFKKKNNFSRMQ